MNDDSNPISNSFVASFSMSSRLIQQSGGGWIHHRCAAYDFNQRITWNPLEGHASARRRFAWREISPVDLVQRVVLRFMSIEARLAGWHVDAVSERQAEKDLQMDDAVHSAAGTLDGFLERVHGAGDVLFERVSYEDVILLGVAVIGTSSGNVIDPVVGVVGAGPTRRIPTRCACGRGCASSRSLLLTENFQRSGYQSCHRRGLAKEVSSGVDFHEVPPSDRRPKKI